MTEPLISVPFAARILTALFQRGRAIKTDEGLPAVRPRRNSHDSVARAQGRLQRNRLAWLTLGMSQARTRVKAGRGSAGGGQDAASPAAMAAAGQRTAGPHGT